MLWTPHNEFQYFESNLSAPASAASVGTTITPAQNSKGSYANILTTDYDTYLIQLTFLRNAVAASIRDTLVDVAIDPAGGTSYTVILPDLLMGGAGTWDLAATPASSFGVQYLFPFFIPAGSQIGIRASVNNATVGTFGAIVGVWGQPTRPELVRAGTFCRSFGVTGASSRGTTVTPGTSAAEGAYTQLGSNTAEDLWWWQFGAGVADTTQTASQVSLLDIAYGDGSTKTPIISNEPLISHSGEQHCFPLLRYGSYACLVPSGSGIYGRWSTNLATADSTCSMAAYGIGG